MTMLTMRCRVLQNELIEGQQEQQAMGKKAIVLEHILQQQQHTEHVAVQRCMPCSSTMPPQSSSTSANATFQTMRDV